MPPNNNLNPNLDIKPKQRHPINGWMLSTIGLILISIVLAGSVIWLYVIYDEQKTNVDTKVETAVSEAKSKQRIEDEKNFTDREKLPFREFVGPDDYGRVSFYYPKTWSAYIYKDASAGGTYEAYLNPVTVPTVSEKQQFALRLSIESDEYSKVVASYDALVKKGDLKSSAVSYNGINGTRLEGNFTKDIRGSAVIIKIRDKTLTLRTDADTFKSDFDALLNTIKMNQ